MATSKWNENYIREAAYYLWQNAGCPMGQDEKFWSMAVEQWSSSCGCTKSTCKKSSSTSTKSSRSVKKTTTTKSSK